MSCSHDEEIVRCKTNDLLPAVPPGRVAYMHSTFLLSSCVSPTCMCGCRHFIQTKTGQDLPKENMESALEELVTTYKTELGLSDKEADQLQHLQVGQNSSNKP